MVRNFRKDVILDKSIIIWDKTGTLPPDFTDFCPLFSTYLKNVLDCATNPGGNPGAADHLHGCSGTHLHSVCPATNPHNHGGTTPSATAPTSTAGSALPFLGGHNLGSHTHPFAVTTQPTAPLTATATDTHTHDTVTNVPARVDARFIQKGSLIGFRHKNIPFKGTILYNNTITGGVLDPNFSPHTSFLNRFIRGVPCGSACPLATGGSDTHTHSCVGHTHSTSGAPHAHVSPGVVTGPHGSTPTQHVPGQPTSPHGSPVGHPVPNTGTVGAAGVDSDTTGHTHGAEDYKPPFVDLAYLQYNTISFRKPGIISKGIVIWDCTLASIPTDYALTDGTSGTTDITDKYTRAIVTAGTDPGTTGGATTHTHANTDHTHTSQNIIHTHPIGTFPPQGSTIHFNTPGSPRLNAHSHPGGGLSPRSSTLSLLSPGSGHTHDAQTSKPTAREEALIERIA